VTPHLAMNMINAVISIPKAVARPLSHAVAWRAESAADGATAWHGGCLALAELARRGLVPVDRLAPAAPLVARALHYDVRRGHHRRAAHLPSPSAAAPPDLQ